MSGLGSYLPLLALTGWLALACAIPFLRLHQQPRLFWLSVMLGVPLLGWLTLHWGPLCGGGAFVLGLWVLVRAPLRPRIPTGREVS